MRLMVVGLLSGAAGAISCYLLTVCKKRKTVLKGKEKIELPLVNIEKLNHNSKVYVFGFPGKEDVLGLPVGKHVSLSTKIEGKLVSRAYTPVSGDEVSGEVRIAVKIYPEGKMTQHLDHMSLGDSLNFGGPKGDFEYLGRGGYTITKKGYAAGKRRTAAFSLIAGGSGLTPVLQVIEAIARDPKDTTQVYMMYANETEADIWYHERLEALQAARPEQFKFWFVLSKPAPSWDQGSGYINAGSMKEHLGPRDMVLMCGPPPMLKALDKCLDGLDVVKEKRFTF
eukprot:TRINITY_DN2812_c0_g2_i1.p2 TRINITY_DN2812_c0_g2~~TRINITY_DN2812_c0_g2_i1.p2  ORF type:complete len:282 (+),score=140.09 TRINITY_DN2812_c0_g2_i1:92-937(+)